VKCFGCQRELEVGDYYIEDTASGFCETDANPAVDGLIAELFGGSTSGKVVFCEDCTHTTADGRYLFETVYGDEDES
jgi:hypothetical protein